MAGPSRGWLLLVVLSVVFVGWACVAPVAPARGAFSGSNGKIAFSAYGPDSGSGVDVFTVNPDGSGLVNLTASIDGTSAGQPAWSPDGQKLAFEMTTPGAPLYSPPEIYVMNADGSAVTQLTSNRVDDGAPAWSPDGTRIAFVRGSSQLADVFVMNADGSQQTNLTNRPGPYENPAWSPDGQKIAFDDVRDVWVMGADGSNPTSLTQDGQDNSHPAWSPDGRKIIFSSIREPLHYFAYDLFVMNPDGSDITRLLSGPIHDLDPAYSPDGRKIAYMTVDDWRTNQIWTANADGTAPEPLPGTEDLTGFAPDWQAVRPADVGLTMHALVQPGRHRISYAAWVRNRGPFTAESVTLSDPLAPSSRFQEIHTSKGVVCRTPSLGQTGQIDCDLGDLTPRSVTFVVVSVAINGAPATVTNTVSVASPTPDLQPRNNSMTQTTNIRWARARTTPSG
jgi:Tol biopolymer transport system component